MKIHSFIFAFAATCLATTTVHADPEVKHDRFKTHTSVSSDKLYAIGSQTYGVQMPLHFLFVMATLSDDRSQDTLAVSILNYSEGSWKYLQCSSIEWLVDDKPFDLGKAVPSREAMHNGVVAEHFLFPTGRRQLVQLANAKRIEWKICNDEYKLNEEGVAGMHKFLGVLDEQLLKVGPAKNPL